MKFEDLKNLAEQGKLKVEKIERGVIYRSKGWRGQKWDDTTQSNWDNTQIPYKRYSYEARMLNMPEHSFYKITKKDYKELSEIIIKLKENL